MDLGDELFQDPNGDPLDGLFGDIIGTVGKIAAAPVNLVASALPKPIQKPFRAISSLASPTALLDPATRKDAQGLLGGIRGNAGARGSVRAIPGAGGKGIFKIAGRAGGGGSLANLNKAAGGSADVMKTLVKAMAAQNIAKTAADAKPRLRARSSGSSAAKDEVLARLVASAVDKQVNPKLKAITKKLQLAENQRLATSEHNAINNVLAFRRKVLQDLMRISACLPENHPTRQKIRRVGIMSGLL